MSQANGAGQQENRPLWIGITTRHGGAEWVQENTRNYVAMVREAGAEPIILSPDIPAVLPDGRAFVPDTQGRVGTQVLDALDGLILSGGGDVHPRYFGQPLAGAEPESIDLLRDELEIELAQAALAQDLPLFGICRGCQVLNVAAGGGMIQHFGGHRTPEGGPTNFHDVAIDPGSRLHTMVGSVTLPVNTFHHQGLDPASLSLLLRRPLSHNPTLGLSKRTRVDRIAGCSAYSGTLSAISSWMQATGVYGRVSSKHVMVMQAMQRSRHMTAQTTEATLSNTKQMLASLQDERDGVTLYSALADLEKSPQMAEVYRRLAAVEGRHAERWQAQLTAAGVTLPPYQPSWRTRMLVWLAQRFGVGFVLPTIASREQIDAGKYQSIAGAADMSGDEISHARLLGQVTQSLPGGLEGSAIAQMEGRHKAGGGNALRAAVLGANDGLVSNMSLVMGVAGASLANNQILVTGLAGLLAGACSMALGEWLSVQSSRELYEKQIAIERAEIEADPQEEAEELALIYQSRGIEEAQALELAQRIVGDQKNALDTLAREELGIDPEELGGSAWEAAITSFLLFSAGAIIPVLPFMFMSGMTAVLVSLVLSTIGLFAIGAGITLFTGRGLLFSGGRQVLFGLAAAAITYGIGHLIGVSIGG